MNLRYQQQLRELLLQIKAGKLYSAKKFAEKKGCHNTTIERQISKLRSLGHQVIYDRTQKKYMIKSD